MKKISVSRLVFVLALILGISIIALNSGDVNAKTIKLKMATEGGAKGTPTADSLDLWAKLIEEKSNGEIKVNVYYQGELGGQQELFDQFVQGNVDMMLTWPLASYDKTISILSTPYMVLSWEDALNAYKPNGWLDNLLKEVFTKMSIHYFGPWPEGFGGVATAKKFATSISAAKEIKVRTPPVFPLADTMRALGYQTADLDWGEVYTAIQTGVVDGDSCNIIFWDYEYFRDLLDYYVHTKHYFVSWILGMNKGSWDSLSKEHQKIIEDAANVVIEKQFKEGKERDEMYRKKAVDAGIEYKTLSDEEYAQAIKEVRKLVWPKMEEVLGSTIMEKVRVNASTP